MNPAPPACKANLIQVNVFLAMTCACTIYQHKVKWP